MLTVPKKARYIVAEHPRRVERFQIILDDSHGDFADLEHRLMLIRYRRTDEKLRETQHYSVDEVLDFLKYSATIE